MSIEVRKIETTYGETGVGVQDRTEVTYELGAEIGGAWIKFVSVPEATVTRLQEAKRNEPAPAPAEPPEPVPAAKVEPTMTHVTPTPAPQAEAAASEQGSAGPDQPPPSETTASI